jgi:hypothetical protein
MQYGKLLIVLMTCVLVVAISAATRTDAGPAPQQDVIRLESRMTQLEQRLYAIDNSLRTLEQQSRMAGVSPRDAARDLEGLRSAVQTLQVRIFEDECALAKLDERTLSPAMREARRKSGAGANDPCRRNVDAPLQLPVQRD